MATPRSPWRAGRGYWTYVRYDPSDPGECEIDGDRLVKDFGKVHGRHARLAFPQWASAELSAERKARADGTLKPGEKFDPMANATTTHWGDPDPGAPTAASASVAGDMVAALKDLVELHASGGITDAEFAEAKSSLLGTG